MYILIIPFLLGFIFIAFFIARTFIDDAQLKRIEKARAGNDFAAFAKSFEHDNVTDKVLFSVFQFFLYFFPDFRITPHRNDNIDEVYSPLPEEFHEKVAELAATLSYGKTIIDYDEIRTICKVEDLVFYIQRVVECE